MHNNIMKFGDIFVPQHKGIAMDMAPTPSIANLFVAIYKDAHITPFPSTFLHFLKCFINNGFGIWLRDPDPVQDNIYWETFKSAINHMILQWEFSERSNSVIFMDLPITKLLSNGQIVTILYTKPIALHLLPPPTHQELHRDLSPDTSTKPTHSAANKVTSTWRSKTSFTALSTVATHLFPLSLFPSLQKTKYATTTTYPPSHGHHHYHNQ